MPVICNRMTETQTISWIFLATALATEQGPATADSISGIADGINHAVPTTQELDTAFRWLIHKQLIEKTGNRYSLTAAGKTLITRAAEDNSPIMSTWNKLDTLLENYE